jgi:hypothetical protein
MTMCIAAHAQESGYPRLVLCFDAMSGTDTFASEILFKCEYLADGIAALYAGTVPKVKELARIYKTELAKTKVTEENLTTVLWEPMRILRERHAARKTEEPLKLTLLITGFIEGSAKIVEVDQDDISELEAYGVTGTSTEVVEALLNWRKQSDFLSVSHTLYNLYEAKRISEVSPHVGREHTTILVLEPTPNGRFIQHVIPSEFMEAQFKEFGPRQLELSYNLPWRDAIKRGME